MHEIPERAAALIFDENGVWLVVPEGTGETGEPAPYVLAACELAARINGFHQVENLAMAFSKRSRDCG